MATDEEIGVVYPNVDEVLRRLRSLAEDADGIAQTDYALTATTGAGGAALEDIGTAMNDFARGVSALITRTADRIEQARAEYEDADFERASRIADIGNAPAAGARGGGGSRW
ncbi:MAG: hypothetical protein SPD98_04820 [Tractidigestivibacter sp.]|uniref:hypothetical protein n=1 Tax=Tractidigestivibacter sp. TaxID=2847320 RepID=UPI002A80B857|nr:hypothetical protein [Tractidigestivibacter sp.]MDY4534554.1 hypothetical protein [Tractidigestivibacter sp.]